MGEVIYIGGFSIGVGKHCFSLVMYGFCSDNALYSASLWFIMFNSFWYHKFYPGVAHKILAYKKACKVAW